MYIVASVQQIWLCFLEFFSNIFNLWLIESVAAEPEDMEGKLY